ncbi:13352_t:CDS:2 [Acaulospora morrowiae]|uniref:13352_t:CDS:1 n=1 Tax=Acaulospora morrowiae TaxID=94023 RepID=A0A9N9FFM4_9GLOM|nr:13352_t:CDS:2 [Acaulospora morrowiae]
MGQSLSSSANNQDQDGDVTMADDSETNVDVNGSEYNRNNQNGSTLYSSLRPHSNRANSQDRTQLPQALTFDHASQNGSPRVLRMTPARRRRQLSSLHPFFPTATTINQTQIPLSRPLNRLQRFHHGSVDDVSLAPRQTDAMAPNMLRRSRTISSSYSGHDSDMMYRMEDNSFPNTDTIFDVRRPRSNSVDAIVDGDLGEDISRSNARIFDRPRRTSTDRGTESIRSHPNETISSNVSDLSSNSSTAGTQTDSSAASTQRLRRRVTRISARRLFGPDTESNNNNNAHTNNEDNDTDNHVLAERAANEGHDGSFESFLAALQRRRQEASNRPSSQPTTTNSPPTPNEEATSIDNNASNTQSSQSMSFFRLFRFGGSRSISSQSDPTTEPAPNTSLPSTTRDESNATNTNNGPQMVPVIIIGIRSVPPRDDINGNLASSQQSENNVPDTDHRSSSGGRFSRSRSASTSSRNSTRPTASTGTQTPPPRSWIIYVLGGTYPSTHPLLTTPSLFSDNPTYEDMLLLSSLLGPARPPTTTQREIDENLPVALYNESIRGVNEHVLLGNAEKCQVCLCDYVADEELRVLNCHHGFHRECIDKWLTEGSNKCPICRGIGVPPRENETANNAIPNAMGPFF